MSPRKQRCSSQLTKLPRTEPRSPQQAPTRTSRSATSPLSRTWSWERMTSLCGRSASSTAATGPWWFPAPGIRRSSTGTCDSSSRPRPCPARRGSTPWTSATTSASWEQPTDTSTLSTSRTLPNSTRLCRARLNGRPGWLAASLTLRVLLLVVSRVVARFSMSRTRTRGKHP